ncbi:hypothetical protein ACHAQH_008865 [Verticillium albo-atrum]
MPVSTRRTFSSNLVTARQPLEPAPSREPRRFTKEDANTELGDVDLELVQKFFPNAGPGNFPILDMKKVDMSAFNEGRPLQERRELILYRLRAPLPADEPNHHILAHVYESDRNGLLMLANNVGLGMSLAAGASLTYSYFVHVNPELAGMKYGDEGDDVWWIQETFFPRVANGRGTLMIRTWSPTGIHVATGYQDGFMKGFNDGKERL